MNDLDFSSITSGLKNVAVDYSGNRKESLKEGPHVCRVTKAEMTKTLKNGRQVAVVFTTEEQKIERWHYFFLAGGPTQKDEGIKKAVEQNLKDFKSMLVHGGHSNPDNPGDIKSLVGLRVGVNFAVPKVKDSLGMWVPEKWDNPKTGEKGLTAGVKPAKFGPFYTPPPLENGYDTDSYVIDSTESGQANGHVEMDDEDETLPF